MRPPERASSPGERGAALLTVLMLVAVIAVLAGTALERLRLSTRLAGNAASGEQARSYAEAAETLATTRITSLLAPNPNQVSLVGGWSGRPFGLPLPGGGDRDRARRRWRQLLQSQFAGHRRSQHRERLCDPSGYGGAIRPIAAQARRAGPIGATDRRRAADWIDTDQDQQSGGAEDQTYLARATPYRTSGTLMSDPSELRAVDGMTPEIYARLRPWVCTLPMAAPSRINVNTLLPEQAPLAAMLFPDTVGAPAIQAALVRRPPQGYASVTTFLNGISSSGAAIPMDNATSQLAITTKFFALTIDVSFGGAQLQEHALVDASHLPARLVSRQWGEQT